MEEGDKGIVIHLKECRNLTSSHADKFNCFARVEHCGEVLGDSVKSEGGSSVGATVVDLRVEVKCSLTNHSSLNNLARSPLLVTFLEVLSKDKKAKEEKTSVLGHTTIDLLPFIRGHDVTPVSLFTAVLQSNSTDITIPVPSSDSQQDIAKPEVDVEITVPSSILGTPDITQSNILSLRLRSLHSLPDAWQPGTFPYTFTMALPLPSSDTDSSPPVVTVPQGTLKLGPDKDTSCVATHWKWPGSGGGQVTSGKIENHAVEDETGELNTKQDVEFRQHSECMKPRVTWNVQHRVWLTPHNTHTLLSQLSQCPLWPVEIARYSLPQTTGKGKGKEEEPTLSHHAVAQLSLAPLLYPGATSIFGAYTLHPFNESDIAAKTKRPYTTLLSQAAPTGGSSKKPANKRAPSSVNKLNEHSNIALNADNTDGEDGEPRSESDIYVDSKSYVVLEIILEKPLIPKRPTSVLAERISEYIPPRPPVPRREGGVQRAVGDFHKKTGDIASVLLTEFRELFGDEVASGTLSDDQEAIDERRKRLLFHLNSSGKYHAFKEQLKVSVVKLVREKYLNQAKTKDRDQLQEFLSELYIFLTDQMHTGLKKVLNMEDAAPPPPSPLNSELLKVFAIEAEQSGNLDVARHHYKERVTREDHVAEVWYDYGVFCLLDSDMDRAEQCFREAVALDQTLVPALLLYGMVCSLDEKFSDAEQFFELSTTADPTNIIAWTMRGLHYELASDAVYQEMCFQEANKLNFGNQSKTFIIPSNKKQTNTSAGSKNIASASMMLKAGGNLKQASVVSVSGGGTGPGTGSGTGPGTDVPSALVASSYSISSKSSAKEPEPPASKPNEDLPSPSESKPKGPTESIVSFNEGGNTTIQDAGSQGGSEGPPPPLNPAQNLSNGSGTSIKTVQSAQQSTVTATGGQPPSQPDDGVAAPSPCEDTVSVFLQTASFLLDIHALKFAEMCLAHEVAGCECELQCPYHIAEARLHIYKQDYDQAKAALEKAITIDYQDPNAWALLGHTHYLTGDFPSAKDAYERTVDYVTPPAHLHTVLLRLADIYLREQQFAKAKETYLHACRRSPTSQTWRGVGVACYELGDLSQAEDALCEANILNNLDPIVWAYLTMICLKTKKPGEAEQAFKFAVKTGLSDASLVNEIKQLQQKHSPTTELAFPPTLCS